MKRFSVIQVPMKLRNLELETTIWCYTVNAFFRNTEESGPNGKYSMAFKFEHERRELIDLRSDIFIRGTPAIDFEANIAARGWYHA